MCVKHGELLARSTNYKLKDQSKEDTHDKYADQVGPHHIKEDLMD